MPNPVVHFEIVSKDPDSLGKFFHDAFGWTIGDAMPGAGVPKYLMAWPDGEQQPPKAGINGGLGATMPGYDGHVTFYIACDDVEAALQKVVSLGGERIMGPEQVPGGPLIALFKDPQGHVIGLVRPDM